MRVIAIDGFPKRSSPGILRELDNLPIEYRWNTRAILIDPKRRAGCSTCIERNGARRSAAGRIRSSKRNRAQLIFTRSKWPPTPRRPWGCGVRRCSVRAIFGNVICLDEDPNRLYENTRIVMKTIQNLGFACRIETINAVEAWRGSLPGDGYSNVRRVMLHTLNLADMLPITSVWAGLRENPSAMMRSTALRCCSRQPVAPRRSASISMCPTWVTR